MSPLVQALSRFNRKERYWLIRNALGENSAQLGDDFRQKLGTLLEAPVPDNAWWAMDYHLEWLIGALQMVAQGESLAISAPSRQRRLFATIRLEDEMSKRAIIPPTLLPGSSHAPCKSQPHRRPRRPALERLCPATCRHQPRTG